MFKDLLAQLILIIPTTFILAGSIYCCFKVLLEGIKDIKDGFLMD